jgi:hypothetical protein
MKNIIPFISKQLKYFLINPFWKDWIVLIIIIVTLIINILIWYLYLHSYRQFINLTPIAYSSGVFLLNTILAVITYPKEKIVSFILLGTGLLIQTFIIFFLKIAIFSGTF